MINSIWNRMKPFVCGIGAALIVNIVLWFLVAFIVFSVFKLRDLEGWLDTYLFSMQTVLLIGPLAGGYVLGLFDRVYPRRDGFIVGFSASLVIPLATTAGSYGWSVVVVFLFAFLAGGFGALGTLIAVSKRQGQLRTSQRISEAAQRMIARPPDRRGAISLAIVIVAISGLWAALFDWTPGANGEWQTKIEIVGKARVVDGNTVEIDGRPIRLAYVDAPALDATCAWRGKRWACGAVSALMLESLIGDSRVECSIHVPDEPIPSRRQPPEIGVCRAVEHHYSGYLNTDLVELGWAAVRDEPVLDAHIVSWIKSAEKKAREAKRGIWSDRRQNSM